MSHLDNFNYQIRGPMAADKVVFLHGLMGSGANWRKISSQLEDAYHILLFDQRGHGRSFHPPAGYSPEDYANDLEQILNELGWERAALVGHSLGGRNALNFASRWPHRVTGLVLEDIGPDANQAAAKRIERLLAMIPTPFTSRPEAMKFLLEEFPTRLSGDPNAFVLAQFFYSNIEQKADGSADWRFSKAGVLASLAAGRVIERWTELQRLTMPTLVIRGARSQDLSHEVYERMLATNPRIQGIEIADAGHWVHSDQPAEFTAVVRKFLQGLHSQPL